MNHKNFILIAEDDLDDQELIASAFYRAAPGMDIEIVNDGREALAFLKENPHLVPCLILLDYNMPELNGAQVVQELSPLAHLSKIPKIIFSTSNNPVYIQDSLSKGAHSYKIKPHDFQSLISIAREMVALCGNAA